MEPREIRLVRQAQKGKREALETLFLMEKEYLYKMAFLYMKNKEDALDLVQESILQCILHLKKLEKPEYFRTWMPRILINCARQEWRKRGRYDVIEEPELWQSESTLQEEVSREEKLDLYEAIDRLAFPYKAIIIQYYFAERGVFSGWGCRRPADFCGAAGNVRSARCCRSTECNRSTACSDSFRCGNNDHSEGIFL